jgi:hypothetical protein
MRVVNVRAEGKRQSQKALSIYLPRKLKNFMINYRSERAVLLPRFKLNAPSKQDRNVNAAIICSVSSLYLVLEFIFLKPVNNLGL